MILDLRKELEYNQALEFILRIWYYILQYILFYNLLQLYYNFFCRKYVKYAKYQNNKKVVNVLI